MRYPVRPASSMAPPAGFEPATLGLEVPCSIQLSYGGVCHRRSRHYSQRARCVAHHISPHTASPQNLPGAGGRGARRSKNAFHMYRRNPYAKNWHGLPGNSAPAFRVRIRVASKLLVSWSRPLFRPAAPCSAFPPRALPPDALLPLAPRTLSPPYRALHAHYMKSRRTRNAPVLHGVSFGRLSQLLSKAGVAELADALDLGSSGATREGSIPFARTTCLGARGALDSSWRNVGDIGRAS